MINHSRRRMLGATVMAVAAAHVRAVGAMESSGETMGKLTYDKRHTAHLVIDPYNDFISEGGKVWDRLRVQSVVFKAHGRHVP